MQYILKIIIIGDPGVGKTSLVKIFIMEKFSKDYRATIGTNIFTYKLKTDTGDIIKMQLWDIAGQERWEKMRHLYYKGAHGVMMVGDLTRRETFKQLITFWKVDLVKYCINAPIFLVCNKSDLKRDLDEKELQMFKNDIETSYFYITSAKTGTNVKDSFENLANELIKNILKDIN